MYYPVFMMRLAAFSAILALTIAQQDNLPNLNTFCRRHQHQTCVIDSKLYVDGGRVYDGPGMNESVLKSSKTILSEPRTEEIG